MMEILAYKKLLAILLGAVFASSAVAFGEEDNLGLLRLKGVNSWRGYPQVKHRNDWRYICAENEEAYLPFARLTCGELGFLQGYMQVQTIAVGDRRLLAVKVNCSGKDSTKDCKFFLNSRCTFRLHLSCQIPCFIGCFSHRNSTPALEAVSTTFTGLTIQKCLKECNLKGFILAGLAHGMTCACGKMIGSHWVDEARCQTFPCRGDIYQSCGGGEEMSVYDTSVGQCGGQLTYRSGKFRYLVSQYYPDSYRGTADCKWGISLSRRSYELQIIFLELLLGRDSILKFSYHLLNGSTVEEHLTNESESAFRFRRHFREVPITSMAVRLLSESDESEVRFAMAFRASQKVLEEIAHSVPPNIISPFTPSTSLIKISATDEMHSKTFNGDFIIGWAAFASFLAILIMMTFLTNSAKISQRRSSSITTNFRRRSKQSSFSSVLDDDITRIRRDHSFMFVRPFVPTGNFVELEPEKLNRCNYLENETRRSRNFEVQEPTEMKAMTSEKNNLGLHGDFHGVNYQDFERGRATE